ncbi:hypothetical protein V6N12_019666 [Hibiscus sabdariffa]|uniref:Beta-glucosidase n=2 Tax=Hibiscus sabdariffa TaxID=183260 RepID=A0ABR2B500_9ROSI
MEVYIGVLLLQIIFLPHSISCDGNLSELVFPSNFLFGTASSAYQYEGGYLSDGKGLNNWDAYSHQPGNLIIDGSNGDIAVDHYHRYLEDVGLMHSLGVNSYRFSISWARILPKGRFGEINEAGIEFYNNLIDALLIKGIQPFVTLTHFDFPQELEDRYGSWMSPQSQEDFAYFADVCFKSFGDRVKYWATFNEPDYQVKFGYLTGFFTILFFDFVTEATVQGIDFTGYLTKLTYRFLEPIIFGRYPPEMRNILGSILPEFTATEKQKLNKGVDFIGVNHYTSYYVQDCMFSVCEPGLGTSKTEGFWAQSSEKNGTPIGEPGELVWQNAYPQGLDKILTYLKDKYHNIPMFITENGYGNMNKADSTTAELLHDAKRAEYIAAYLGALSTAIRNFLAEHSKVQYQQQPKDANNSPFYY